VPRLELIEPGGEPLGTIHNLAFGPCSLRHRIIILGRLAYGVLPRQWPFLHPDLPRDVCEQSGQRHFPCNRSVLVAKTCGGWRLGRQNGGSAAAKGSVGVCAGGLSIVGKRYCAGRRFVWPCCGESRGVIQAGDVLGCAVVYSTPAILLKCR